MIKNNLHLFIVILFSADALGAEESALGKLNTQDGQLEYKTLSNSFYASKDTFGMRANAVVAAFSANSNSLFDYPITGFSYLMQMGKYLDRDSVGLYADNTSPPFKKWELVNGVTYTPTSFMAKNYNTESLRPGMLVDTNSEPKWSSYIVSVKKDKIITAGWVNTKNGHLGTPENGTDLIVNPITKIWATNFNIFFPPHGRSDKGVVQENAIVNNSVMNPKFINGIDVVILPQSKFGGTSAFISRSANNGNEQQWEYGFLSLGAVNSFVSSDSGKKSPEISFHENSASINGMVFEGRNKINSILWKSKGKISASIGPDGEFSMLSLRTSFVTNNTNLATDYSRYVFQNKTKIEVILPDTNFLNPGFTLKLVKTSNADIILKTKDKTNINGQSFVLTEGQWSKDIFFYNNEWFFY